MHYRQFFRLMPASDDSSSAYRGTASIFCKLPETVPQTAAALDALVVLLQKKCILRDTLNMFSIKCNAQPSLYHSCDKWFW